jgi:putative ABC transport system permease protein
VNWLRFFKRTNWDRERAAELESYVEAEAADNIARGMNPADARAAALRKLGNPAAIREKIYQMNTVTFISSLGQDLRYAVRMLRKSPGFALAGIGLLALGIGANTAIFSVVNAALLQPLPYPDADRIVVLDRSNSPDLTMDEYQYWKDHARSYSSLAGWRGSSQLELTLPAETRSIQAALVTTDFFRTLGVAPAMGREFNPAEITPGGPNVVILTNSLWRSAFNGDTAVIGRAVAISGKAYNIIGVLPPNFWLPEEADAFVPLRFTGSAMDHGTNTLVLARLAPGVSRERANAECAALSALFQRSKLEIFTPSYNGLRATPYHEVLTGDVRTELLLLLGASGLLLAIACSNLASLLGTRLAARRRELALRMAIGVGRGRLARQILLENIVLTAAGGVAGVLLAGAILKTFVALIPFRLAVAGPVTLNAAVLLFALAIAFTTGILIGVAPALSSSRMNLHDALKSGGRMVGAVRQRARGGLVVAEVALSATLLVSAGLLIQTLYRIHQEPLGFQPHGILTFYTPPPKNASQDQWMFQAVLQNLRMVPGVRSVAAINQLPLVGHGNFPTQVAGEPEKSIGGMEIRHVTTDYFGTMGVALRRGRVFTDRDDAASPPVVIVNEAVVKAWWPDSNPVGHHIQVGLFRGRKMGDDAVREVVGVVENTKVDEVTQPARPMVYLPVPQTAWYDGGMNWVLRVDSSQGMAERVRRAVAAANPRQRVDRLRSMDEVVASGARDSRFDASIFGFFAALALLMTSMCVYGLLSFTVARRANEIGTRIALGASRGAVLRLVLRQGMGLVAAGLVIGLAGALLVTRSMAGMLYGVRAKDPIDFAATAGLMFAAGAAASYFPARRAAAVDPKVALRAE